MINQHLTDIIWYTNEHIKVRNACFFSDNQTILNEGGKDGGCCSWGPAWDLLRGLLAPSAQTLNCVSVFSFPLNMGKASRKSSLPSCGETHPIHPAPAQRPQTGLSSSQHVCEDVHMIREERQDAAAQEVSVLSPVPWSRWLMAPFTPDGVGRQIKAPDSGRTLSRKGTGLGCRLDLLSSEVSSVEHLEMF